MPGYDTRQGNVAVRYMEKYRDAEGYLVQAEVQPTTAWEKAGHFHFDNIAQHTDVRSHATPWLRLNLCAGKVELSAKWEAQGPRWRDETGLVSVCWWAQGIHRNTRWLTVAVGNTKIDQGLAVREIRLGRKACMIPIWGPEKFWARNSVRLGLSDALIW